MVLYKMSGIGQCIANDTAKWKQFIFTESLKRIENKELYRWSGTDHASYMPNSNVNR